MPRRMPPAHALHAFDAAARHMSFTGAARELRITQAAVSQRIRLLERQLGQALFVRHARGIELTEAGRAFVPAVHEAFQRLAVGLEEAFGPGRDAPLTIRATPGFAAYWLARRLHGFRARHPGITLRITTAVWPSDFDTEGADLEIRYGRGEWNDVECLRLTRERLTPACSPAVAGELGTPADLSGQTLLHAVGFASGWPQWLAAVGASDVADRGHALLCDTMAVVMEFAAQGLGVAMGWTSFLETPLEEGRLVTPFPYWLDAEEAFYLASPRGMPLRPEALRFWSWMADTVAGGR